MKTKTEGPESLTLAYPLAGDVHPHAVSSTTGGLDRAFVYDVNGDQVGSGDDAAHGFDAEGRLAETLDVQPPAGAPVPASGLQCTDVTGNGVDNDDATAILGAVGASTQAPSDPPYDIALDLTDDGFIDLSDAVQELTAFGEVCPTSKQRYVYDASGTLVERKQLAPITEPDGTHGWTVTGSTVYIGGVYEEQRDAGGAVTGTTKYYQGFGRTVAMRKDGALLYPLLDHLGSTVAMTGASGAVLSRQAYWPYGTTRSLQAYAPVTETDKLYTGQRQESGDQALGLYNYRARFYSTTTGAFVSADTADDGPNRFGYVHGNPATFADPTGHGPINCDSCDPSPPCTGYNTAACTSTPGQHRNRTTQHDRDVANCESHPVECGAWAGDQHDRDLLTCAANPQACEAWAYPPASAPSCSTANDPMCARTADGGEPDPSNDCSGPINSTECAPGDAGGHQSLDCASRKTGCRAGVTEPYGPGDNPWAQPPDPGPAYPAVQFATTRSGDCYAALFLLGVVGGSAYGSAGVGGVAESPWIEPLSYEVATTC